MKNSKFQISIVSTMMMQMMMSSLKRGGFLI